MRWSLRQKERGLLRLLKRKRTPGLVNGTSQSEKAHCAYSPPSSSANITISEGTQRLQSTLQFCQHHYATLISDESINVVISFR
jgi:hypothetical protein